MGERISPCLKPVITLTVSDAVFAILTSIEMFSRGVPPRQTNGEHASVRRSVATFLVVHKSVSFFAFLVLFDES